MLGTIIAIMVVDKRGRRKVLLRTVPVLIFCLVGLTAFNKLFSYQISCLADKWASLFLTLLFLVTYSSGLDTIPWLINSEIYPPSYIGVASSIAAFVNWTVNYILLQTFDKAFFNRCWDALLVLNVLGYFFLFYFLVETQGKSIRQNLSLILKKSPDEVLKLLSKQAVED